MKNSVCPYTCHPVSTIDSSREHIVPDALGGPEAFALAADIKRNSTYGATVDSRLIRSPLIGMLAARAGVETRSGPSTWKAQGRLMEDGSPVELVGNKDSVTFRFRKPVDVDPETRQVRGVKAFGADIDTELARVTRDLERKGRTVVPTGTKNLDSRVHGSFEHNLSESVQGLTKIAYLATVWALGDDFIETDAAATYRLWLDVEPTVPNFESAGLQPLGVSMFKRPGKPAQHHIACIARSGKVLTGVRLFGEPIFEIALAVDVPEMRLPDGHGRFVTIDATKRTFGIELLVP